jgi:hypothetical protein
MGKTAAAGPIKMSKRAKGFGGYCASGRFWS